jgi:hypothetical protein
MHDSLQKGHQGEKECLRHADVHEWCETRGETGLCVVSRETTFEGRKVLHTFEIRLSAIESLALSIAIFLRGYSALFHSQAIKT